MTYSTSILWTRTNFCVCVLSNCGFVFTNDTFRVWSGWWEFRHGFVAKMGVPSEGKVKYSNSCVFSVVGNICRVHNKKVPFCTRLKRATSTASISLSAFAIPTKKTSTKNMSYLTSISSTSKFVSKNKAHFRSGQRWYGKLMSPGYQGIGYSFKI